VLFDVLHLGAKTSCGSHGGVGGSGWKIY
jgi:hypothetical protein